MPHMDNQGYAAVLREVVVATSSGGAVAGRMVRLLEGEFNRFVTTFPSLGRDASGEEIRPVGGRWVTIAESIY